VIKHIDMEETGVMKRRKTVWVAASADEFVQLQPYYPLNPAWPYETLTPAISHYISVHPVGLNRHKGSHDS